MTLFGKSLDVKLHFNASDQYRLYYILLRRLLRSNQAPTKVLKPISIKFTSVPPMSKIFKFQLKLIIDGADQSLRKIDFMAFFGLVGLQNKI